VSAEATNKRAIRAAFDSAATRYDHAATVQREICRRLAALAACHPAANDAPRILDAGCGTGHGFELLRRHYPAAAGVFLDLAPAMLKMVRQNVDIVPAPPVIAGDIEALPLRDRCIDAIWSSLALQWCRPGAAMLEFARVGRPGAVAWLATLGPATFDELRSAFASVDDRQHTIAFHAPDIWRAAAENAGFELLACERSIIRGHAPTLRELLRDIKAVGAHTLPTRRRALLGRNAWRKLNEHYESYRDDDDRLPVSYDTILLTLRKTV